MCYNLFYFVIFSISYALLKIHLIPLYELKKYKLIDKISLARWSKNGFIKFRSRFKPLTIASITVSHACTIVIVTFMQIYTTAQMRDPDFMFSEILIILYQSQVVPL